MFVPDAPNYANYGAIGMGLGHEITHGYDDLGNWLIFFQKLAFSGSQYDADGNLRSWWRPETLATFQQKKQCFVAQYGSKIEPSTDKKVVFIDTINKKF